MLRVIRVIELWSASSLETTSDLRARSSYELYVFNKESSIA